MVGAGLELDGALLALAAASHSGEPLHVDGVVRILAGVGLGPDCLGNVAGLPLDPAAQLAVTSAGGGPEPVLHNCSGKHAGMLATSVAAGWPVDGYLSPDHLVQRHITAGIEALAGEEVAAVVVDGCGAPQHALSLTGLARAFQALAGAPASTPEGRVAAAVRAHPWWAGGTGRPVTRLLAGVPGLVAKDGAEGVMAAATADGIAVAVKIADGAQRAAVPVLVATLASQGVDVAAVADLAAVPVLGGGRRVGDLRVTGITGP
jgi:L-asparaginase II